MANDRPWFYRHPTLALVVAVVVLPVVLIVGGIVGAIEGVCEAWDAVRSAIDEVQRQRKEQRRG